MDRDNRRNEVLAVAFLFLFLSWATVCLRFYVRGIFKKTWGNDDSFIGATLFLFTVYIAFQIVAAIHGTGRHRSELSDSDARTALLFWYLCELLYILSNCTLKISIGYFYLRVAVQRWHVWCIYILMCGTVLFGMAYFFLVTFQCKPISEFWINHPASDKCFSLSITTGITYSLSAVNALADWALGTLPIFIVWDLKMKRKTKVLVVSILAFAAIGSTATVVRMFYVHTLMNGEDFLYATTDVAIWSTVEPGIGITASSIATLRPLFRQFLWSMGVGPEPARPSRYYFSDSDQKRRGRRGYRRSLSPSDLAPTRMNGTTSTEIHGPQKTTPSLPDHTLSQDYTLTELPPIYMADESLAPNGQIMQTTTFQQEYYDSVPTLRLRDSLSVSFARGSILSLGRSHNTDP